MPNSIPNSALCPSPQRRNSRHAAIIFSVMPPPAAWIAASIPAPISLKISPTTCWIRSSWLPKYRYSAGAVMPISRAMARSVTASGPCSTRIFRAVCLISAVVSARTRSRLASIWTTDPPDSRTGTS